MKRKNRIYYVTKFAALILCFFIISYGFSGCIPKEYNVFVVFAYHDSYFSSKLEEELEDAGFFVEEYDEFGKGNVIIGAFSDFKDAVYNKNKVQNLNFGSYIKKINVSKMCKMLLECVEDAESSTILQTELKKEILRQEKINKTKDEESFLASVNELYKELKVDLLTQPLDELKAALLSSFGLYLCQNFA